MKAQLFEQKPGSPMSNPDLIREYLMRTREPPAIFQTSAMTSYNPVKALHQKFVNMAYKHPQLLIGDEKDECEKVAGCDVESTVVNTDENYGNIQNECERSTFKTNFINGNNNGQQILQRSGTLNTNCHLIGNVKPNLIKTWEQLNGMPAQYRSNDQLNAQKHQQHDENNDHHQLQQPQQQQCDTYINPSIYLNTKKYHLFSNQQMENLPQNNNDESFVIRRPPSKSGYFYDSIEIETQDDDDDDEEDGQQEVIASLCEELENGGEAMAEYISLIEKKDKHCWSIDSCN